MFLAVIRLKWLNFRNGGVVVVVKKGETTLANLEQNLTSIFCKFKNWPWQIREYSRS
jgi:hypothetical protein